MSDPGAPQTAEETLAALERRERRAAANGIEIAYDEFGDPGGEPLLLVMGLGMQMIAWDERFCGLLAERGYRVVRFDNRDVGHSTKFDRAGVPARAAMISGTGHPPYLLSDMAADTIGLLDHLEIERAHVAGVSMGGMISQELAISYPGRIGSMASIMSTTGNRWLRLPKWKAMAMLMARPPSDAEAYMRLAARTFDVIGSPGQRMDEDSFRVLIEASHRRCFYPDGVARQLHAINCSGNRTRALRRLDLPVLVIHGSVDPLIRPAAGRATARAIPSARLKVVPGMGHDLSPAFWPQIVEALDANARRARVAARAAA
ncbi:MAG: alpha/beta fold hydrolase [Solirubrobacterales bacterium]